jgi:hypothetical protein
MKTRSIFGPLVLIAIGILWLLAITNTIPLANLWALAHLVPFVLIAIGISLLVRAVWPAGGMIVSILIVAGIILAVLFAPQLGWNMVPSWAMRWDIGSNVGGGVAGSGNVVSETRTVSGINALEVDYPSDVIIQQGEVESVTVEAEDNLMPQLSTQVVNGSLVIRNTESDWSKRVNPSKGLRVSITVKELQAVQFSSAGSLEIHGLAMDQLDIQISGICDVTITDLDADVLNYQLSGLGSSTAAGVAERLNLQLSGLGDFNAGDLAVQRADAQISGAGSATLWVSEQLDARISGAGSLNYYGDPAVTQQITGAGSVNDKGDK